MVSAFFLPALLTFAQQTSQTGMQVPADSGQPITTLTANAHLVVLDVVVVDKKGRPVKGLKSADFTVLEDHQPQKLSSFEEHNPITPAEAAALPSTPKLPPNTYTNYAPVPNNSAVNVLLLDALDTHVSDQMYLRSQMVKYMKTVAPGTPIAIFMLDTRLHLLQGFTSDPQVLRDFVNGKHNMPVFSPLLGAQGAGGSSDQAFMRQGMRLQYLQDAMRQLGRYLNGIPGRKNLIWFTGNIPVNPLGNDAIGDPFPDLNNFMDTMMSATDVLTLSRVAVYPVDARGLMTDPAFSAANGNLGTDGFGGMGMARPANPNSNNFLLETGDQHMTMDELAEATGGKAFYNSNGLKQAITEVIDSGSNYYTFSYSPTDRKWNGRYRKIEIKLAGLDAGQGYQLQYRRGYNAVDPGDGMLRAARGRLRVRTAFTRGGGDRPSVMQAAMERGALAPTQIIFKVRVTASPTLIKKQLVPQLPTGNKADLKKMKYPARAYTVNFAADARNMYFTATPDGIYHDNIEFVALLYDADGDVVNQVDYTVRADLNPKVYGQVLRAGINLHMAIAVPAKGDYFLRMGVHDVGGDKVGATEVPVEEIKLDVADATPLGALPTQRN